jgi:hypothetical protein
MKHVSTIKSAPKTTKSSSTFISSLYNATSKGLTENLAVTYIRSGSSLLDFYAQGGSMRKSPEQALDLFKKAFAEDREKAVRILFYLRDARGGMGERSLFRLCLEWLATDVPEVFSQIVEHVPEYGRWDDMFFDNDQCFWMIRTQLEEDKDSENPSLLAKWIFTINASSSNTRTKAKFMARKLGFHEIEYRKLIRKIRRQIKAVEEKMSARQWEQIDYSTVPSQAARIYRKAFQRHDPLRYVEFVNRAEKGEVKIQAKTLYPYQIYKSVKRGYSRTLEALWNQLPDYTQGKNAIVVADVSGSMTCYGGDPMAVSVSLALYFAERNKGQFQNYFITFSRRPRLQFIQGQTLRDKMNSLERAEWEMNTDLQAVFDLVLNTGLQNSVPQEEMPETIYIISDMEFDNACNRRTNFEVIKAKYVDSGYKMPNLVFWNVSATGKNLSVTKNEQGVSMVSGFSPVVFKIAVEGKTPEEIMLDTINSERYARIVVA